MPYVKFTTGHTGTAAIEKYLEKDGRALSADYINLDAPVVDVADGLEIYGAFDWATEMDTTRHECGNDVPWRGLPARTFKHYIISPDPEDRIDLPTLRRLAKTWAEKHFADYEVSIVYHDDNEEGILHAHLVINNTNLRTGHRLQEPSPKENNDSLQELAREMGLTSFAAEGVSRQQGGDFGAPPLQRNHVGRAERELESKGKYSWVADIRSRVEIAKAVSKSKEEFLDVLSALGIEASSNSPRSDRRDFVYSFAGHPTWKVRGEKLGLDYGRYAVERGFSIHGLDRASEHRAVTIARSAVDVGDMGELKELSLLISVCERYAARSIDELEELAGRSTGEDLDQLKRAISFAREHDVIPARDVINTRESSRSNQARRWEQRPWRESRENEDESRQQRSQQQAQQRRNRERNEHDR